MENYEIGKEIEGYCTKCKHDTTHVITAIEGETVSRVMCNLCYSYHKFKPPREQEEAEPTVVRKIAVAKVKKTVDPKKAAEPKVRRVTVSKTDSWYTVIDKIDKGNAIDYIFSQNYKNGNVLNHKKFGLGVVKSVVSDQKIVVLFESGLKTLVQNWEETQ